MSSLIRNRCAAGLCFATLLFFPFPSGGDKFLWKPIGDAVHFPIFFLSTLFIYSEIRRHISTAEKAITFSILLGATLAITTEVIQPLFGRSASLVDVWIGLLGALVAGYSLALWRRLGLARSCAHILGVAVLIQLFALFPAWKAYQALLLREQWFPVLGSFEHVAETVFWRPMRSKNNPHPAKISLLSAPGTEIHQSLRVETHTQTWSGVYYDAGSQDWSEYSSLVLEAYNPENNAFPLSIRIDDTENCEKYRDRFNRKLPLKPGRNLFRIPLSEIKDGPEARKLRLESIRFLHLFLDKTEPSRVWNLTRVYLESVERN